MKTTKKIFNFNLPNELKEYLKYKSTLKKTTISQYIIDLIVTDMEKTDFYENGLIEKVFDALKNKSSDTNNIKNILLSESKEVKDIIKQEMQSLIKKEAKKQRK